MLYVNVIGVDKDEDYYYYEEIFFMGRNVNFVLLFECYNMDKDSEGVFEW